MGDQETISPPETEHVEPSTYDLSEGEKSNLKRLNEEVEGINPEEIITDDWSDDGDLELETEDQE